MRTVVIYHANCSDGFCSAWLMHSVFPNAVFHAANYDDEPPEFYDNDEVYILDFSYPREVMLGIKLRVKYLLVLDHHKTAQAACEGLDFCVFDMNKSGAGLTLQFLESQGYKLPIGAGKLVNYVQDRDLWRHSLSYTKEVNAAIRSYPFEFDEWYNLAAVLHVDDTRLTDEGTAILRYRSQIIKKHVEKSTQVQINGVLGLEVCCTVGEIISDIGEMLGAMYPIGAVYSDMNGIRQYSLRSTTVDVSAIAKTFGGGGHAMAAGFRIPITEIKNGQIPSVTARVQTT